MDIHELLHLHGFELTDSASQAGSYYTILHLVNQAFYF